MKRRITWLLRRASWKDTWWNSCRPERIDPPRVSFHHFGAAKCCCYSDTHTPAQCVCVCVCVGPTPYGCWRGEKMNVGLNIDPADGNNGAGLSISYWGSCNTSAIPEWKRKNEKPNQESLPSMYSSGRSASPGLDERQIRLLDTHTHIYPEEANLLEWANKNKPTMQIGEEKKRKRSVVMMTGPSRHNYTTRLGDIEGRKDKKKKKKKN